MNNWIQMFLAVFAIIMITTAFTSTTFQEAWDVPDKYVKMENPVKSSSGVLSTGKSLYSKHCQSCHGKEGWGDGSKAAQLETPCGDFSEEAFQAQSDGSLFYKIMKGRGDMPGYEKKIPYKEDIWSIVHYLRTLE